LTIKLTRHTAASASTQLHNLSSRAEHQFREANLMRSRGTCCFVWISTKATTRRENSMSLKLPAHRAPDSLKSRAPAGVSLIGTHKNLQPCRLPNLFSYQTSSSPA